MYRDDVDTSTEYIVFRYRKDLRFRNGINPRTFEYVGDFSKVKPNLEEIQKDNNYVYAIETITKYRKVAM